MLCVKVYHRFVLFHDILGPDTLLSAVSHLPPVLFWNFWQGLRGMMQFIAPTMTPVTQGCFSVSSFDTSSIIKHIRFDRIFKNQTIIIDGNKISLILVLAFFEKPFTFDSF
jgi:hypothetical protein